MANGQNTDITISVGLISKQLNKQLAAAKKAVRTAFATGKDITPALNNFNAVEKNVNRINKALAPAQREFAGWAMSLMFLGMAMKRTFDTIWKSSTKTFNDVMHSVNGAVTGFDMLGGSLDYLKFTIGAALEPIAYLLLPIIDGFTEWASAHEKVVRWAVVLLGVIGSLTMWLGMAKLGWDGVVVAIAKFMGKITLITSLVTSLTSAFGTAGMLGMLVLIGYGFYNLYSIVKEVFGNNGIWGFIKATWKNITEGFESVVKAFTEGGIFAGLFEGFVVVFTNIAAFVKNIFIFIWNTVIGAIFGMLKASMKAGIALINLLNKIPGINISTAGNQRMLDSYGNLQNMLQQDYSNAQDIRDSVSPVTNFITNTITIDKSTDDETVDKILLATGAVA